MANPFPKYVFSRTDQFILAAFVLAYIGIVTGLIISGNGGAFSYIFDDAYIHLSVAENILHGTYGINPGEFSAPSSSILWPFILAPFSWTTFFDYIPLILNALFAVVTVNIIYRTVIIGLSKVQATEADTVNRVAAIIITVIIALATNILGLVFSGMEHPLQVLLECLIFYGLVRFLMEGDSRRLLYISAVLLPLVRFEGLALTFPVLLVMFIMNSRKYALIAFAALAVSMYAFSLFLFANSGWFLPASVLLKSGYFNVPYGPAHFAKVFLQVVRGSRTVPLMYAFVMLLPVVAYAAFVAKDRIQTALGFVILSFILTYFVWLGNAGDRYLVPVYVLAAVGAAVLLRKGLQGLFRKNIALGAVLVLAIAGMTCTSNYFYQKKIPNAAGNIYEQHYTMHRFVTEFYRQPVAANDIGWVSYRNPYYLLDLAGLGSYDVMSIPQPLSDRQMDSLVLANGAHLVMIYKEWFENIPDWWTEIGSFHLIRRKVTAANPSVVLYVADSSMLHYARTELKAFRQSLAHPELVRIAE